MIIFNSLMIYRLYKSSRSSKIVQNSSLIRKEHQFTIAAMSSNGLFFFFNFPLSIFYLFYDANLYSGAFKNSSTLSVLYAFYMNICLNVSFSFQALSIFMYLAFNKLFRKELIKIISYILPFKCLRTINTETSATNEMRKYNNNQLSLTIQN